MAVKTASGTEQSFPEKRSYTNNCKDSVAETTVSAPREIPTVVSLPRNDKLYGRSWHFIRISNFIPKRTPEPPCHCERRRSRSVAISREGRLTCVHDSPKHLPAAALHRTALSLRAKAQPQRGNLPEGKTYLRTRTKNPFRGGFLHCVRVKTLTPVEMTSWTIDNFKAFPLGGATRRHEVP